ncbi:unnamed protein product [Cuscuta epithymum]|uniref:MBD domain-containing protein n=1 Tax=Cuscuta epithymum TaxID=186058 RepID=A0AAV0GAQ6_9ASTE|nr:unnamed protein product [Cuscuta epithymum]
MVAGKSPGTLPSGWSEHIKVKKGRKIKHYVDPVSGYSFLSKMDALRYVETGDIGKCVKKPKKDDSLLGAYNKSNHIQESSGNEVSENEKPTNIESEASIQPTSGNEVSNALSSVAVKDNAVDGLPPGWVKEIKTRVHAHGIRRDPLYIDPVSGYVFFSKKDVMRYVETGDIGKCLIRPKKRDSLLESNSKYHYADPVSGYSSLPKMDAMPYMETGDIGKCVKKPMKDDSLLGAYNKSNHIQESSGNEVSENEKPTNIESEASIQPTSGNEVSENEKPTDIESEASIQPTSGNEVSKTVSSATVKDNAVDGLPPGWVKEIKTRVHAHGIRRDPLYIDPVSGYAFFSKKDVMRYVETGDIGKCLMRPKKRDSLSETCRKYHYADPVSEYSSLPKMDAMPYMETCDIGKCVKKPKKDDSLLGAYNKSESSRKEVSENEKPTNIESEVSIPPTSGNEVSENEKPTDIESEASIQPTSGNEVSNTVSSVAVKDNAVDGLPPGWVKEIKTRVHAHGIRRDPVYIDPVSGYVFFSKKDVMRYVETGDIGKCLTRPKKRDSLSETYRKYDSPSATMGKITRQSICSNEETRVTDSGNGSTSSRFSKRLAGHNPEEVADLGLVSEQTLRVAIRNHAGTDTANTSSAQILNYPPRHVHDLSNSVGSEREASLVPACQDLQPATNSGVTEPDETVKGDKHSPVAENQAVSEDPKPILGDDSEPRYPFGDCLSDPCFEFAFKTLTGAIPVEDFIPCERASHKESYPPLSEACFDLPIFDSFPNDMPSRSAPPDKHTSKNLMTATSPTTTKAKP